MPIYTILIRSILWSLIALAVFVVIGLVYDLAGLLHSLPDQGWSRRVFRLIGFGVANLVLTAVLASVALLFLWGRVASRLSDLQGWHLQRPPSEFTAIKAHANYSLEEYLTNEDQVFRELDEMIHGTWSSDQPEGAYSRFHPDSVSNPANILDHNWNKSRLLQTTNPKGGVLLLHGLSDSPYSLRCVGERLRREGYTVIWLRVPGHGTCPSALAAISWKDWIAAVKVAVRGLKKMIPPKTPLILGGYSNGGALSVHYALSALDDDSLPRVDSLILFSPMVGINAMARMTLLYHFVALASGNKKAQWSNVSAEIDPFKYTSWPMNGSVQAWAMTQVIERKLSAMHKAGRMHEMPPVLAFQSVVDSTVITAKLITVLFNRLVTSTSQLFLFDINRVDRLSNLLKRSFEKSVVPILQDANVPFQLSVLRNTSPSSQNVEVQTRSSGARSVEQTNLEWPAGIASLSHVAVPFSMDDPVYGTSKATSNTALSLGSLSLLTEPSSLTIPVSLFVRCRHNPFYEFMEDRIVRWLEKSTGDNNT